jgi:hypothetical protein
LPKSDCRKNLTLSYKISVRFSIGNPTQK